MAERDVVAYVREYTSRGWAVIALPEGSKRPTERGWQTNLLTEVDFQILVSQGLNPNCGMMTGKPSNNTVRVDLDHPAAVRAAPLGLPPTRLSMGRDGNPRSGYFYVIEGGLSKSITYKDPSATGDEATILDVLWT